MNRKQAIAASKNFIAATNLSDADGQFEARITDWHKYGHSRMNNPASVSMLSGERKPRFRF